MQVPVPELGKLRGEHIGVKDLSGARVLDIKGDTLEIVAVFGSVDQGGCGLRVRRSNDGSRRLAITYAKGVLDVFGTQVEVAPEGVDKTLSLHVFLDKSIIEVYVNGGRQTVVRVMVPPAGDLGIEAFTDGVCAVDVWKLSGIWK